MGDAAPSPRLIGVRQHRWRERQKTPARAVALIECERDAVLQALVRAGRLSETEAPDIWRRDRARVAKELSGVIEQWATQVNKSFQDQQDREQSMLIYKTKDNSQLDPEPNGDGEFTDEQVDAIASCLADIRMEFQDKIDQTQTAIAELRGQMQAVLALLSNNNTRSIEASETIRKLTVGRD